VTRLDPELASTLLAGLPLDRAATLLRPLAPETREAILGALPRPERLRTLLTYPRGTAGALMDPSVLALPADLDLDEARRRIGQFARRLALDVYLVDADHRLRAVADLREVLQPSRRGTLAELGRAVPPLPVQADLATVEAHHGWLQRDTVPVVDDQGTFLGAVRAERLRQLARDELARQTRGGAEAVAALGELFWLGLSGLFSTLSRRNGEAT
jgi:magnesium transporter